MYLYILIPGKNCPGSFKIFSGFQEIVKHDRNLNLHVDKITGESSNIYIKLNITNIV